MSRVRTAYSRPPAETVGMGVSWQGMGVAEVVVLQLLQEMVQMVQIQQVVQEEQEEMVPTEMVEMEVITQARVLQVLQPAAVVVAEVMQVEIRHQELQDG